MKKLLLSGMLLASALLAPTAGAVTSEEADAMLAPLEYISALNMNVGQKWWGGTWYNSGYATYNDYASLIQTPGAKLMVVVQFKENSYWHKFFIKANDVYILQDDTGNDAVSGEKSPLYNSSGVSKTSTPFPLDEDCFYLLDPPVLEANGRITGEGTWTSSESGQQGWFTTLQEMFVVVPNAGHLWELKFVECPATLPLGESAPCRALLIDKITGATNEACVVTYSTGEENCHYENGRLHAWATAESTTVTATTSYTDPETNETKEYTATASVRVPSLNIDRFIEVAHWDVDISVRNWWTDVTAASYYGELARLMKKPLYAIKITYTHEAEGPSWNQMRIRTNYDERTFWHLGPPGKNYNEGDQIEALSFFAHPFDHLNQISYNTNNAHIDRITFYEPILATYIFLR